MAINGAAGMHISWPAVAAVVAMAAMLVTGAIQLGTVQTHVLINTDRLTLFEAREREHLTEIATIKARQQMNEERIRTLESAKRVEK